MIRRLAWLLFLVATCACAHKPSDSYLSIRVEQQKILGQWDIALRDLDFAIGLDANQDGAITWGEVRAKTREIDSYALARLRIGPAAAPCATTVTDHLIDKHVDGAYVVLRFGAVCTAMPRTLGIAYRLFFELDPLHKGLLNLTTPEGARAGVFSVDKPEQQFALGEVSRLDQFLDYAQEGVFHIWTGFDHILFLLSLLLPAVLVRDRDATARWRGAPSFRRAFWGVFKVVTAFTVAHSITLSLAALQIVSLPSRLTESLIAASVVLAALNNVFPLVFDGRWALAFLFGLIHGFGFASVLTDLGLPRESLLLALVSFNVGVEAGQLVIVGVFLPLAYALRSTVLYRRGVLVGGSFAIALVAAVWLVERVFDLSILPSFSVSS